MARYTRKTNYSTTSRRPSSTRPRPRPIPRPSEEKMVSMKEVWQAIQELQRDPHYDWYQELSNSGTRDLGCCVTGCGSGEHPCWCCFTHHWKTIGPVKAIKYAWTSWVN